jgi:hypothetical protein
MQLDSHKSHYNNAYGTARHLDRMPLITSSPKVVSASTDVEDVVSIFETLFETHIRNQTTVCVFDDLSEASAHVEHFSEAMADALIMVYGGQSGGGRRGKPWDQSYKIMFQNTIWNFLVDIINSQHAQQYVPADKLVNFQTCQNLFGNIYNTILHIPIPHNQYDRVYVDGENYFNDRRASPVSFAGLMSRVTGIIKSPNLNMVVFVKNTNERVDAEAVSRNGHVLINACATIPCFDQGKLVNREIDDVLMLTTALFENFRYGREQATIVSNDRFQFFPTYNLILIPLFLQNGGGRRDNVLGIGALLIVTAVAAILGSL